MPTLMSVRDLSAGDWIDDPFNPGRVLRLACPPVTSVADWHAAMRMVVPPSLQCFDQNLDERASAGDGRTLRAAIEAGEASALFLLTEDGLVVHHTTPGDQYVLVGPCDMGMTEVELTELV